MADWKPFIHGIGTLPITLDFRPDVAVLAAVAVGILAVGVATGLAPGFHASTPHLATALNGEVATGGRRKTLARNLLVALQVAACTAISIGVGICLKSLNNQQNADTGYSARNVAILNVDSLEKNGYTEEQGRAMYERLREAVGRLPGIESFSVGGASPLDPIPEGFVAPADAPDSALNGRAVTVEIVDGKYFATTGIPLLAGRVFGEGDSKNAPEVAVINRTMAERYWPNQDPVGKNLIVNDEKKGKRALTVAGIVGDARYESLDEKLQPCVYLSIEQHYWPTPALLVRTQGDPEPLFAPLSAILRQMDPKLGFDTSTLEDRIRFKLYLPQLVLNCVGAFGALAWMLAAVGLYGAIFYSVGERKAEVGIRVALGAEPWHLWKMILRETGLVTGAGIAAGMCAGIATTVVVRAWLSGIQPVEWSVLGCVALAIGAMAIATAYAAGRRWVRADPLEAVRHV